MTRFAGRKRLALVHGNKLNSNGSITLLFQQKLEKAAELLRDGEVDFVIISGGRTRPQFPSEARVALEAFPSNLRDRVLLEERSRSTGENIMFTDELLYEHGVNPTKLVVIAALRHEGRIRVQFKKLWSRVYEKIEFIGIDGKEGVVEKIIHHILFVLAWIDPGENIISLLKYGFRGGSIAA